MVKKLGGYVCENAGCRKLMEHPIITVSAKSGHDLHYCSSKCFTKHYCKPKNKKK